MKDGEKEGAEPLDSVAKVSNPIGPLMNLQVPAAHSGLKKKSQLNFRLKC